MATLEAASVPDDREWRTAGTDFDNVNANFGKPVSTLFGGGKAELILTGE